MKDIERKISTVLQLKSFKHEAMIGHKAMLPVARQFLAKQQAYEAG